MLLSLVTETFGWLAALVNHKPYLSSILLLLPGISKNIIKNHSRYNLIGAHHWVGLICGNRYSLNITLL